MEAQSASSRRMRWYYLFLFAVVAGYSVHFLSFTVFDGFSTFSNDAGSYVLMARKWSPWFAPTAAELFTWPVHPYPPAFPFLLAITGASESFWAGHLVVSVCMLAGVLLMGVFLGRQTDRGIAAWVLVACCLAPGVIIHSLGILSENLYLLTSLAALTVYLRIRNGAYVSWGWYFCLLFFISAAVLTRSVGVALVAGFALSALFEKGLPPKRRMFVLGTVVLSVVVWQALVAVQGQEANLDYQFLWSKFFSLEGHSLQELVARNFHSIHFNLVKLVSAWGHYLFLSQPGYWFFSFSYALLAFCAVALALRALRLRVDAVYVVIYLAVILMWPHPLEMVRFLHPVVFLVLAQPVLYLSEHNMLRSPSWTSKSVVALLVVLILHEGFVQAKLLKLQSRAESDTPLIAHVFEYYDGRSGPISEEVARLYAVLFQYISASAEGIESDSIVAALKHEHFTILADRASVTLSTAVPRNQQLCNFKLKNVDVVFLTHLISPLNREGLNLMDDYEPLSRQVRTMSSPDGTTVAQVLVLDKAKVEAELRDSGFNCERFVEAM